MIRHPWESDRVWVPGVYNQVLILMKAIVYSPVFRVIHARGLGRGPDDAKNGDTNPGK